MIRPPQARSLDKQKQRDNDYCICLFVCLFIYLYIFKSVYAITLAGLSEHEIPGAIRAGGGLPGNVLNA